MDSDGCARNFVSKDVESLSDALHVLLLWYSGGLLLTVIVALGVLTDF